MTDEKDKKKKSDGDEKEDPHRQILPALIGEAREIFEWLAERFTITPRDTAPGKPKSEPDEFPERIVLCPVFGVGGVNRGPELWSKTYKPTMSAVPSHEALAALANEFLRHAKRHASNVTRKRQRYCLFAYNNVKGPNAYAHHYFVESPGAREYSEKDVPAADDEDTHRDRELSSMRAHLRWVIEHNDETISGVIKLQQEMLAQAREHELQLHERIRQMEADRRANMLAVEEALSKKLERETAAEWAKMRNTVFTDMWTTVKALLPAAMTWISKGKAGIVEGLRTFLGGLSEEVTAALLGQWKNGECLQAGVLDREQVQLITGIASGDVEPKLLVNFIQSLRPEQFENAQRVLRPDQVQLLMSLAQAASDTANAGAHA
jgi:hypothetical protein